MQPPTSGDVWLGLSGEPLPVTAAAGGAVRPDGGAVGGVAGSGPPRPTWLVRSRECPVVPDRAADRDRARVDRDVAAAAQAARDALEHRRFPGADEGVVARRRRGP